MFKSTFLVVVVVSLTLLSDLAIANQDGIHGNIVMQSQLSDPDHGDSSLSNDVNMYITNSKIGFGIDTTFSQEKDFTKIKPFATWQLSDAFNVNGGFSTNSLGADHMIFGLSYFQNLNKKANILISPKIFVGVSDEAEEYLDLFFKLNHKLGNDFTVSIEAIYDYWPQSESSWLLIGPVLSYAVHENFSIFTRIAISSDLEENEDFNARVGLKFSF